MTDKESGMTSAGGDAETPLIRLCHERDLGVAPKQPVESAI